MKKNEKGVLERNLEQKAFKNAAKVIKDGKESGNLTNVELIENLVESYRGKTVEAPIEVILTSVIFLNAGELLGVIESLKSIIHTKMLEKLREKADRGEATIKDTIATLMLGAIAKEESKEN